MNLADIVETYLEPRKANGEGEFWIRCPFCGDDQYRMGINVLDGRCHCFRASCEWKSSDRHYTFRELAKVLNITDTQDAVPIVKKQKARVATRKTTRYAPLPKEFETFKDLDDDVTKKAYDYLISRGLTDKQIGKHKLGFCAVGEYAYRIIIPVFRKKHLVSYTGRDFTGAPMRWKNFPGPKYIYNIPKIKRAKAVLLEGPFDVFAVERAIHYCDSLGRLGAGLTASSIRDLMQYDDIVVWPDPDRGGIQLAIDTCVSMSKRGKRMSVIMPVEDDVDPGKLGETEDGLEEIRQKVKGCVRWSEAVHTKLRHFSAFNTIAFGRESRKKQ